ncbi:MAG: tRNA preQ1(34) S-adenosylmethionine ribosyltransferase-isomerase QueA [Candidatus Margulisbacteria bacterium]|nr:tRNA preQ1(34) S-adenosylmethionine ribosyltransferase-isomerase QueA [Candidatus Margulisiibacteriota bacterium]
MKTSDFDYKFPQELIAHEPAKKRDESRLMVFDRKPQSISHKHFYDIVDYLNPGDLLVLNDTKVIPARLIGRKVGGGARIEVLLVNRTQNTEHGAQEWKCLVKPGKRLKIGTKVDFGRGKLVGTVVEKLETGEQIISFKYKGNFWNVISKLGKTPLPPYINPPTRNSSTRYQTVYAAKQGASAAPTAGLHFTPGLLKKLRKKGVKIAYITLHTGLGTFLPVRTEEIKDHQMHSEYFEVPKQTISAIKKAKRVVAVGTTVVRTLENVFASKTLRLKGESDLFIYPGYKFKVVDAMITNFHWPRSTLIMLVSAFAGKEFTMKAYKQAIKEKYRLFSFGDAMLIL